MVTFVFCQGCHLVNEHHSPNKMGKTKLLTQSAMIFADSPAWDLAQQFTDPVRGERRHAALAGHTSFL
jgi:hypothetical protein